MAKNKTFSFDDLNAELAELNPLGSVMDQSNFSEVTEWINTGNYHLNACVSGSLFKDGQITDLVRLQDLQEPVRHS